MVVTPFVVGLGGSQRPESVSGRALRVALDHAARTGARTVLFTAADIDLPLFDPSRKPQPLQAGKLIAALRQADGVILAASSYNGGVSSFVKNAIDYIYAMAGDERPYLEGRAIGCIAVGGGWQAGGPVLAALRATAHALRGWPTPLGVMINASEPNLADDADGSPAGGQLCALAEQVVWFARAKAALDRCGDAEAALS